mmetsp:Transcript_22292/g.66057  ORF Transcript_22292/g.66057 Transcript_22292/m.66057 type:complete len:224 (-) Transcript_22292:77-748(-)
MGRSQVAYNRRHGRPGSGAGRGQGGTAGQATVSSAKGGATSSGAYLGSNAWRYEKKRDDKVGDDGSERATGDWEVEESGGGYGEFGAAVHDVSSTSAMIGVGEEFESDAGRSLDLDLIALSRSLSSLPVGDRLRLPSHVAQHWDEKYGGSVEKKTVSEIRAASSNVVIAAETSTKESPKGVSNATSKVIGEGKVDDDVRKDKDEGDDDGDCEDDLAWLDSMIS